MKVKTEYYSGSSKSGRKKVVHVEIGITENSLWTHYFGERFIGSFFGISDESKKDPNLLYDWCFEYFDIKKGWYNIQ